MAKCSICQHPKHNEIDKALVEPTASIRGISRQYQVSEDALQRHVKNGHVAVKIKKSAIAQEKIVVEDFLTHLQKRRERFAEMAREARDKSDPHLELKVYQVAGKYSELEGKAFGAFRDKVEHTGAGGGPIRIRSASEMTDEELMQIIDGKK